jgi:hypothetical protein
MTTTTMPFGVPPEDEPLAVRDTLPITRRSRTATRFTIALLVALGLSAGFLGGVLVQKHQGGSTTDSGAAGLAALARQFGGAAGAAGAAGGSGGAGAGGASGGSALGGRGAFGGGTTGQIKLIDGTNIYVTDAQGNTVKVSTTPSSTFSTTQPSTFAALQLGDTVVVRGTTGTDGTVSATSITDSGAQTAP